MQPDVAHREEAREKIGIYEVDFHDPSGRSLFDLPAVRPPPFRRCPARPIMNRSALMPVDAIVRLSFQSNTSANQAANQALVGHTQNSAGPGPFVRVGTAAYSVNGGNETAVGQALADLGKALSDFATDLDFVSISLLRR